MQKTETTSAPAPIIGRPYKSEAERVTCLTTVSLYIVKRALDEGEEDQERLVAYANIWVLASQIMQESEGQIPDVLLRWHDELARRMGLEEESQGKRHAIERLPPFYQMPNSSALKSFQKLLALGGEPRESSVTKEDWTKEEWTDEMGVHTLRFVRKAGKQTATFVIRNPENVIPGSTRRAKKRATAPMRKLTAFVFQKANQQNYPSVIAVDLQEMVELKMYGSVNAADTGLSTYVDRMGDTSIDVSERGRGKSTRVSGRMFYGYRRKNKVAYIYVYEQLNMRAFAGEWTMLPTWAYSLKQGAFDLVYHVFYVARQNTGKLAENGCFTVSLKAIQDAMGLPTIDEAGRKSKQYIRTPIEKAIEEIEATVEADPEAKNRFLMTPMWDEYARSTEEWLMGKVEICLRDEYAEAFLAFEEKKQDKARKRIAKSAKGAKR